MLGRDGLGFDTMRVEEIPAWVLERLTTETSEVASQIVMTLLGI